VKNIFTKNPTLPYHVFTKSLKVRYPAELPPTLLAQACTFILILDRFSMFSPFPCLFIPYQIFRRWTFVASEAQMQSAVAAKGHANI